MFLISKSISFPSFKLVTPSVFHLFFQSPNLAVPPLAAQILPPLEVDLESGITLFLLLI